MQQFKIKLNFSEFFCKALKGNLRKMSIVAENPFNGDLLPGILEE